MPNKSFSVLKQCRVCGYEFDDLYPWGVDGKTPSFEICDCCGTEFGHDDATLLAIKQKRAKWIEGGALWARPQVRPSHWSVETALAKIPHEYL